MILIPWRCCSLCLVERALCSSIMSKGQPLQSFFLGTSLLLAVQVVSSIQLDEAFIDVNLSVLVNIRVKKKKKF